MYNQNFRVERLKTDLLLQTSNPKIFALLVRYINKKKKKTSFSLCAGVLSCASTVITTTCILHSKPQCKPSN
jgi:hypothetical protein